MRKVLAGKYATLLVDIEKESAKLSTCMVREGTIQILCRDREFCGTYYRTIGRGYRVMVRNEHLESEESSLKREIRQLSQKLSLLETKKKSRSEILECVPG